MGSGWRSLLLFAALCGCLAAPTDPAPVPGASSEAALNPLQGLARSTISNITLIVDGEEAEGIAIVPAQSNPAFLVLLCHGLREPLTLYEPFLRQAAAEGAIAVAMDYRGTHDWKAMTGANDTFAATLAFRAAYPSITSVLLYGFSLGGEVAGMAIAKAPARTFDYWFNGAGVMDLAAEWTAEPLFREDMEAETGGTPSQVPHAYRIRSPLSFPEAIAAHGLKRAYILHTPEDPFVPYTQARDMFDALVRVRVNASLYSVPLPDPGASQVVLHNGGGWESMWPFVERRLDGLPPPSAPSIQGIHDPTTGTTHPPDR